MSVFLLALMMMAGFMAIAAEYGSQEDPLVSLSYINNVLAPETLKKIDLAIFDKLVQANGELNAIVGNYTAQIESRIAAYEQQQSDPSSAVSAELVDAIADAVIAKMGAVPTQEKWEVVKIPKGKTMTFSVGGQVLLRIGSAVCVAPSSPGLINLTAGGELTDGKDLAKNSLYMITVDGRGLKASKEDATVVAIGKYTIK